MENIHNGKLVELLLSYGKKVDTGKLFHVLVPEAALKEIVDQLVISRMNYIVPRKRSSGETSE